MLLKDLAKKEDKGNKKIANKRIDFRRQARTNYFIHNNRLYYKYKKNNIKAIEYKIPFREEILPIIKNIHISNNHCVYKALCNQILLNKYYLEGYSNYVKEYLNEYELCNGNKKK